MLFDNDTTPAFHPTRRHLLGAGSALALGDDGLEGLPGLACSGPA